VSNTCFPHIAQIPWNKKYKLIYKVNKNVQGKHCAKRKKPEKNLRFLLTETVQTNNTMVKRCSGLSLDWSHFRISSTKDRTAFYSIINSTAWKYRSIPSIWMLRFRISPRDSNHRTALYNIKIIKSNTRKSCPIVTDVTQGLHPYSKVLQTYLTADYNIVLLLWKSGDKELKGHQRLYKRIRKKVLCLYAIIEYRVKLLSSAIFVHWINLKEIEHNSNEMLVRMM